MPWPSEGDRVRVSAYVQDDVAVNVSPDQFTRRDAENYIRREQFDNGELTIEILPPEE